MPQSNNRRWEGVCVCVCGGGGGGGMSTGLQCNRMSKLPEQKEKINANLCAGCMCSPNSPSCLSRQSSLYISQSCFQAITWILRKQFTSKALYTAKGVFFLSSNKTANRSCLVRLHFLVRVLSVREAEGGGGGGYMGWWKFHHHKKTLNTVFLEIS